MQMNEMITYALRFLWTEKIGWSREKQVGINSTREQAPLFFLKVRSTISTKNKQQNNLGNSLSRN